MRVPRVEFFFSLYAGDEVPKEVITKVRKELAVDLVLEFELTQRLYQEEFDKRLLEEGYYNERI